ncbi:MAG: hypothetical protein GY841_06385 [FCB group bacterium]|nr:hypothetical protein [FCB group bacterium]
MRNFHFTIISRSLVGIMMIFLALLSFGGCDQSPADQRQARLENFLSILPDPIRDSFVNRKYNLTVEQIEVSLAKDPEFAARWTAIKKAEAIDLFNTAEVIDYFVDYFVNYRASGN